MSLHGSIPEMNQNGSTYHRIKGYSNTGLPGNPLNGDKISEDPYVAEQQRLQHLLKNPSLRMESDGSLVYDPNYLPKNKKIIRMASYDEREDFDPVDPLFWLICACVVGLAAFVAFVIVCALQLPFQFMLTTPVYIAAGSCAGFLFLVLFIFYSGVSSDERWYGRIWDGFIGAIPFILLGGAVGYMYSGFVLLMVQLVNESEAYSLNITWWFCIFSSVPPFLLFFIPMFVVAMQVQEASSLSARLFSGNPLPPAGYIPRKQKPAGYIFSALRRTIVGFAMGVGMAAYYAITCFALGWIAYGLYMSSIHIRPWLPAVIIGPIVFIIICFLLVLCCIPASGKLFYIIKILLRPWTGPLAGWARVPLRSAYFPRYYVGNTISQMIREANSHTRKGGKYHVRGEHSKAEEEFHEADVKRSEIENRGIELKERESRSWRRLYTQKQHGVARKRDVGKK